MKHSVLTLLIFLGFFANGQIESPFGKGTEFLGMGNAAAGSDGISSLFYNQAGITSVENLSLSLQGARLYNDSGINHIHGGIIIPSENLGTLGVRISSFGLEGYQFQNYSLSYARRLFTNFSMAASFNLYQFRIENYGNVFTPNLELGFLTDLSDKITLGAHIANPLPLAISEGTEFPTIFSVGLKYKVSELVFINADVEKNIRETQNFKVGVNYRIHELVHLRAGINTFPATFYFGLSVKWNQFQIDLGNGYHQILGNSTGIGVVYTNVGK